DRRFLAWALRIDSFHTVCRSTGRGGDILADEVTRRVSGAFRDHKNKHGQREHSDLSMLIC
ncbi:MAG: hypothetical protein ACE5JU_25525, partial [Candidatus Binatia bacterium]